ncbi:MAG: DUF5011 domain-containing protein, partial [Clostridiales bacterium]|nr:DUF5011 domain-containing protein [Clostridiales bacterium]
MKKTKLILAIVAILAALVAAAACKKQPPAPTVNLVDFPATVTETVDLGSLYTLERYVLDEDGNRYDLSAVVKTAAGTAVQTIQSRFDVTVLAGYTVTYTAVIAAGDTRTSVVTLVVEDHETPAVNVGNPASGVVGETYTLPGITATDLSGSAVTVDVKVFFSGGDDPDEITLTKTGDVYTFVPAAAGTYLIRVVATDAAGNASVPREVEFIVEASALPGEVFNPANAAAETKITPNLTGLTASVVAAGHGGEGYDGAYLVWDGSAFTKSEWVNFALSPRFALSTYAAYDKIAVWIYLETSDPVSRGAWLSFYNDLGYRCELTTDTWTLILLDAAAFTQ